MLGDKVEEEYGNWWLLCGGCKRKLKKEPTSFMQLRYMSCPPTLNAIHEKLLMHALGTGYCIYLVLLLCLRNYFCNDG